MLNARLKDTQMALERASGRLKKALTARLQLRVAPELKFEYDAGQGEARPHRPAPGRREEGSNEARRREVSAASARQQPPPHFLVGQHL